VTDTWPTLTIGEFEHVAVGPLGVLLRVSGTWAGPDPGPERRPALGADLGGDLEVFEPLPAPSDPPGVLRAAYSVPATLITAAARFWLDLGDGVTVDLLSPTAGSARRAVADGEPTADDSDQVETISAAFTGVGGRAAALQAENEKLSATLDELEIWRGELERRLADTTTELAEMRAGLAQARAAAEMEALVARAEAEALEQAAHELIEAANCAARARAEGSSTPR
jgi:hypothetical protein